MPEESLTVAQADRFIFRTSAESPPSLRAPDSITDFSVLDRVDLTAIDANAAAPGNQAFAFIGASGFHNKAGELRFTVVNGTGILMGDTNGNGLPDFHIALSGVTSFGAGGVFL